MRAWMAALGLGLLLAVAVPAAAQTEREPETRSLDIDLKLGLDFFRLGAKLFGPRGYAGGGWLNGQKRSDGFSLDGRLENDGRVYNFKFNADIDELLRRAAPASLDL